MSQASHTPLDAAPRAVLYTRQGCHLCDDARRLLEEQGLTPECIDIDENPALRQRFDTCVPVVEIDGKIRFRGRVDAVLLRRILRHRR
jgi:glutaredoxin